MFFHFDPFIEPFVFINILNFFNHFIPCIVKNIAHVYNIREFLLSTGVDTIKIIQSKCKQHKRNNRNSIKTTQTAHSKFAKIFLEAEGKK